MAVSSNRSPSPISTRPNPDSKRTPEANSATRRSFSSNPFLRPSILTNPRSFDPVTPANSPADFGGRRNSIGKDAGASSRGYEEKENAKDQNLKPVKARSPSVSKGVKNFMAPTISASSKVNPSPRKKVLAERNELIRTSISFSDGKSSFGSVKFSDVVEDIDSKLEMDLNENKVEDSKDSTITNSDHKDDVFEIPEIAKASNVDRPFNSLVPLNSQNHSEPVESNCFSASPSCCKYEPFDGSSLSPTIAPLDADPSLPPYDPKTNYLSPRPRFRCYNPNQRIEVHLHKENGVGNCSEEEGKKVEESFMSESFSDTEVTEETESQNSQKDSEDASSAEVINQDEEPQVSEPNPISSSAPTVSHVSKDTAEARRPQFLKRSKSIALLLVFLILCLSISVTDSPVFDSSVYNDLSMYQFYVPSEITMFAKASFDGLAMYVKHWSYNSMGYLSKLVRILGGVDELGPLQSCNLTYLPEDLFVVEYLEVDHRVETQEATEGGVETELQEEKDEPAIEADDSEIEECMTLKAEVVVEPYSSEVLQSEEQSHTALPMPFEDQSVLTSMASEVKYEVEVPDVVETVECDEELSSGDKTESTIAGANSERSLEMAFSAVHGHGAVDSSSSNMSEDKFSVHHMFAISLLALALGAAAAFIYLKQGRDTALLNEKMNYNPVSASIKQINQDRPSSQIWETEVDMDGEESSYPSEMSSFRKSSTCSERMTGTNEAQSQERKERENYKRESLASSSGYSMGSSYGSFTTYERIPSKHGCDDEEIVTPVRRSNRIKNQVTSP